MSTKSRNSRVASGALQGGASGATIGATIGPWGAAIGGAAGGLAGGLAGYLADEAETEDQRAAMENDPEYQMQMRRKKTLDLLGQSLGRAFAGMKQSRLGAPSGI